MDTSELRASDLMIVSKSMEERNRAIEGALEAGRHIVRCEALLLSATQQHIIMDPVGDTDVDYWYDGFVAIKNSETERQPVTALIQGLAYNGLCRRTGLARRYQHLDESPTELRSGDRIVLRLPDGATKLSEPVRAALQTVPAMADSQRLLPSLAAA